MAKNNRITAICGMLLLIFSIIAIVLVSSTGFTEQDVEAENVALVLGSVNTRPQLFVISMWAFLVANLCGMGFGKGLHNVLKGDRPWLDFGELAIRIGFVAFIIETLMTIAAGIGLATTFVEATGSDQMLIESMALSLLIFRNHTALLAGLLIAIGALFFGSAMLKQTGFPRWLAYLALSSGIFGLVGAFHPFADVLSLVRALGYGLFMLWAFISGLILLRRTV